VQALRLECQRWTRQTTMQTVLQQQQRPHSANTCRDRVQLLVLVS
jgi:hypothetical protein